MDWEYALAQLTSLATGSRTAFYVVLPSEVNAQYTDPTLMATRMVSGFRVATTSSTTGIIGVGLIAWSDIDDTVPTATELPGPITNGNMDWVIRQVHPVLALGGGGESLVQPGDRTVEAKSRRRLGSDRGLLCVIQNLSGVAVDGVVDVRCLIKE